MDATSLNVWGSSITAFVMGVIASYQTYVAKKAKDEVKQTKEQAECNLADAAVSSQHKQLAVMMEKESNDWRARYERNDKEWAARYDRTQDVAEEKYSKIHIELEAQREYWHEKAKKDQELVLKYQEENAALKATRDFTPIIEHIKRQDLDRVEQCRINGELFTAINGLAHSLEKLNEKLDKAA